MGKYIVELDDIYRSITAYKLVKRRKDGTFGPLYIDCRHHFEIGEWQEAKYDIIKPGYAVRPGWHTCKHMSAPHIKPRPDRYWMKVKVADYIEFERPEGQGGTWFLSKWIKPLNIISKYEGGGIWER